MIGIRHRVSDMHGALGIFDIFQVTLIFFHKTWLKFYNCVFSMYKTSIKLLSIYDVLYGIKNMVFDRLVT